MEVRMARENAPKYEEVSSSLPKAEHKGDTEDWAGVVFREKLRPQLEEAERERARAFSLIWLPLSIHRKR